MAASQRQRAQSRSADASYGIEFTSLIDGESRNLMNRSCEKGVALILTLILLFVLSVMAVSLMFISQTETWSSLNYRLTSQARDGAEAGINSAANFIMNSYVEPGGPSDPASAYGTTVSPVTCCGSSTVTLSTMSSVPSHYPVPSVQNAFNTSGAGKGSMTAGNTTINYNTYATLLSMTQAFHAFGTDPTTNTTVQTWQIVSEGSISTVQNAKVQVSAILEEHRTPTFNYAAFATDNGCGALQFGGGGTTNSYDSSTVVVGTTPTFSTTYGNVGTNGNLATNGNPTTINGTLSTPRSGVGTCTSNNVTAWTDTSGHVTGGVVELPQTVVYPIPVIPPPGTTDLSFGHNATCPTLTLIPFCNSSGQDIYLPPGSYHDIVVTGNETLHLSPGTYNINSIKEQSAQSGIVIDQAPCASPCISTLYNPVTNPLGTGAVILNVTGNGGGTVVDLTGNSVQNPSLVPTNFQIMYAGTGTVSLKGNTSASGVLYAPNASFSFGGNSDWYGAVIGKAMTDMGGAAIHYDRRLQNMDFTVGPWMLDSFTWKKY
jgi:Tfp pilus assembly protein PilX